MPHLPVANWEKNFSKVRISEEFLRQFCWILYISWLSYIYILWLHLWGARGIIEYLKWHDLFSYYFPLQYVTSQGFAQFEVVSQLSADTTLAETQSSDSSYIAVECTWNQVKKVLESPRDASCKVVNIFPSLILCYWGLCHIV